VGAVGFWGTKKTNVASCSFSRRAMEEKALNSRGKKNEKKRKKEKGPSIGGEKRTEARSHRRGKSRHEVKKANGLKLAAGSAEKKSRYALASKRIFRLPTRRGAKNRGAE